MPSIYGSDSSRSVSPTPSFNQGPVPTPGHGLDQGSRSNSPFQHSLPIETSHRSRNYSESNRSRSNSSNKSRSSHSRSRSKSERSQTPASNRSHSVESNKSNSSKIQKSRKSRSRTRRSERTSSNRSESSASNRPGSVASHDSGSTQSHRSGSANSKKSSSEHSERSGSANSRKSGSIHSRRSGSAHSEGSRSRRAKSAESVGSAKSHRSESMSRRSRSRSVSRERHSRSNTPNLQIDDGSNDSSPNTEKGNKRKRSSSEEENKKRSLIDSDSDENVPKKAAELFGDADDISSDEDKREKEAKVSDKEEQDDEDGERERDRYQSENEEETEHKSIAENEEDREPEPIPETRIDVEIPKITTDLGKDIHFVKLPNFLSVETRPFDQETYEDEIDEEETLDEEGRARLKLKVENTIRWREAFDKDGNIIKESNTRFIKWSDGSLSLHLGSEIFDVYKQPLQGDHNHLFIRQGTGLQGQAVFRTKLTFRPHSTESFTHRKMTLSLADRSQKTSGIKILSQVGVDPDQDRKTLLKKEEEKLRQSTRSKPRKRGETTTRALSGNTTFREEDGSDEENAISLSAIKSKYKSGAHQKSKVSIYSSDEEGSDIETRRGKRIDKSKAIQDSDSDTNDSE